MSQEFFVFSNGFERSPAGAASHSHQDHHLAQQIRRDKLRLQGFDHPPLIEDEESGSGLNPVYETAGMLSEMFNFPPTPLPAGELNPVAPPQHGSSDDWYTKTNPHQISNTAAMHLFLTRSSPEPPPAVAAPPSTLHMLLPNQSLQGFNVNFGPPPSEINWAGNNNNHNPNDQIGAGTLIEGRGLSLSLSSSLQHMEAAAKVEEFRMKEGELMYNYNQAGNHQHQYRNLHSGQTQQIQIGFGSSIGLRNSKYVKAAQELLEEFCSVGRSPFKKLLNRPPQNTNPNGGGGDNGGDSTSLGKDPVRNLTAADRIEHQRRKVKLLSMLDEVDRRYNHYCEQMQMVVNSFDLVMGFGSASPYTALAQKAMSRHFRCLKEAVTAQMKHSCELLGEKDGAGTSSGLTKGETPRLKLLEQSLRQQRAFHQMGMMDQEAWRPQRGLPERSVNVLRAWLFEHFLHPYPSDADKHLLARQTGLSKNQVSNWFINARVRLWKPMVEEMYQQEAKDEDDVDQSDDDKLDSHAQTPSTTTATSLPLPPLPTPTETIENVDPSSLMRQHFFENQATAVPPPPMMMGQLPESYVVDDTCRRGSMVTDHHHYGTTGSDNNNNNNNIGSSTLIRFGTTVAGDVSLTLGLRHAGNNNNMPEKGSSFSLRDFGGI